MGTNWADVTIKKYPSSLGVRDILFPKGEGGVMQFFKIFRWHFGIYNEIDKCPVGTILRIIGANFVVLSEKDGHVITTPGVNTSTSK